MKYILLAYTNKADWETVDTSSPEFIAMCQFYEDLGRELTESGEFVATEGLADPSLTVTVRKTDKGAVAVDGPYAEFKEVLVSYAIVDTATHDRAVEIAARIVEAIGDTVEIRPIPDGPDGS
ncbi:YciI family protein [Kribbella sp. NPDC002412]